jgi:phage gp29-like protein
MEARILDQYGRPARWDPVPVEAPDVWNGYRSPPPRPTKRLTPQKLTSIFDQADAGWPSQQAALYQDSMLKDGRLGGQWLVRARAVSRLEWDLQPASADAVDQRVVEFLEPKLRRLGWRAVIRQLVWGAAAGYAASQIHWSHAAGEVDVLKLEHWPTRFLLPDETGAITKLASVANPTGWSMPTAKFIVHEGGELDADPVSSGCFRPAAWYWFFKNHVLKQWLAHTETYGQPLRVAKFPPGASPADRKTAYQMLLNLGQEAVALLPESFQVEVVKAMEARDPAMYQALLQRCDEEVSILLLGQTLTTSIGETGGAYAAANVHNDVRLEITESDAEALAETIRRDLLTPWVRFQFGADAEPPEFRLLVQEPEDLEAKAKTYRVLTREVGLPIGRSHLYETFGIPVPEEGEETVGGGPSPSPDNGSPALANRALLDLGGVVARQAGARAALAGKAPAPGGWDTPPAGWRTW